jgi:hypothetical protein
MAENDAAALVVALSAQMTKFEKDMQAAASLADKATREIENKFAKANPSFPGIEGGLQKLLGGVAIGAIVSQMKTLTAEVAHMGEAAERVGLTSDEFQKLQFAIVATGGSATTASAGMDKFSKNISEAARGAGELYKVFTLNNVALKDTNGNLVPTTTLLARAADLIANTKNKQDAMNLSVQLFGRQAGPEMANALRDGAAGLKAFGDQAEDSGVIIDRELIERAKRINAQFNTVALRFGNFWKEVAVNAADIMTAARDLLKSDMSNDAESTVAIIRRLKAAQDEIMKGDHPESDTLLEVNRQLLIMRQRLDAINIARAKIGKEPVLEVPKAILTVGDPTRMPDVQDEAFEKLLEKQRERIALLGAETESIGKTAGEQERLKVQIQLESEARRALIPLTDDRRAAIMREADAMAAAAARLQQYRDKFQGVNDALRFGGNELVNVLDAATQKGFKFGDAMASVLRNVSKQMLEAAITGEGAFAKMLGMNSKTGGVGGLMGLFAAALGGGSGVLPGGAPLGMGGIGHAAEGGTIAPGGLAYVGEHGPNPRMIRAGGEPIVVTPSELVSGGKGGSDAHVTMNVTVYGDNIGDPKVFAAMIVERAKAHVIPLVREAVSQRRL